MKTTVSDEMLVTFAWRHAEGILNTGLRFVELFEESERERTELGFASDYVHTREYLRSSIQDSNYVDAMILSFLEPYDEVKHGTKKAFDKRKKDIRTTLMKYTGLK